MHDHQLLSRVPDGSDLMEWIQFDNPNTDIDGQTCVPMWRAGESVDWDLAVGHLFN